MTTAQIRTIINNIEEIEKGVTLSRIRELDIHELCKRKKVVTNNKNSYLYFLTPLISKYVHVKMDRDANSKAENEPHLNILDNDELDFDISDKQHSNHEDKIIVSTYNNEKLVKTNSSKLRINEIANSQTNDETTIPIQEREQSKDEKKEVNELVELVDEVNECSKRTHHSSALSSSSFVEEEAVRSRLVQRIYFSFTQGECAAITLFERAVLLHRFMKRLCNEGLTAYEIVKYNLYGILADYLECDYIGNYHLRTDSILHFEYLIQKHYNEGIQEYLEYTIDECVEIKDVVEHIKKYEVLNKNETSLRVRLYIITAIQTIKNKRNTKFIYKFIPLLNESVIEEMLEDLIE